MNREQREILKFIKDSGGSATYTKIGMKRGYTKLLRNLDSLVFDGKLITGKAGAYQLPTTQPIHSTTEQVFSNETESTTT